MWKVTVCVTYPPQISRSATLSEKNSIDLSSIFGLTLGIKVTDGRNNPLDLHGVDLALSIMIEEAWISSECVRRWIILGSGQSFSTNAPIDSLLTQRFGHGPRHPHGHRKKVPKKGNTGGERKNRKSGGRKGVKANSTNITETPLNIHHSACANPKQIVIWCNEKTESKFRKTNLKFFSHEYTPRRCSGLSLSRKVNYV